MPASYLKRLPLQGKISFIDVHIRQGGAADALNWHAFVQGHVKTTRPQAPDAKWNWPWLLRTSTATEYVLGRRVGLFCLDVPSQDGKAVPLGMMMLSEGYPSLDGGTTPCVYIWYVATVPSAALKTLKAAVDKPGMILEALLDTAIQRSYELGYDGRVGLHADQSGGEELFAKYRDKSRMIALASKVSLSLIRQLKSGNDGRYFWTDPKLAQSLSNSLNYLR